MGMVLRAIKPPVSKVYLADSFPTNGALGAPWTRFGTSPYLPVVFNGAFRIADNTTDGTNYGYALHQTQLATDRQRVGATITTTNSTWPSWVTLNSDSTGQNTVFLNWVRSTLGIWKKVAGTDTSLATVSESQVVGKRMELVCDESGGIYTYTAYINDVQRLSWTDSSNTLVHDSTRRYVGLGGTRRRAIFTSSWSPNLDDWFGEDL